MEPNDAVWEHSQLLNFDSSLTEIEHVEPTLSNKVSSLKVSSPLSVGGGECLWEQNQKEIEASESIRIRFL